MTIKQSGRNGKRYVYITESYRDELGRPRQRVIERHGRLGDLVAAEPDALRRLEERAKELSVSAQPIREVRIDLAQSSDLTAPLRLGHLLPQGVFEALGIGSAAATATGAGPRGELCARTLRVMACGQVVFPLEGLFPSARMAGLFGLDTPAPSDVRMALTLLGKVGDQIQAATWTAYRQLFGPPTTGHIYLAHPLDLSARALRDKSLVVLADETGSPVFSRLVIAGRSESRINLDPITRAAQQATVGQRAIVVGRPRDLSDSLICWLRSKGHGWTIAAPSRRADEEPASWIADRRGWSWDPGWAVRTKSRIHTRSVKSDQLARPQSVRERWTALSEPGLEGAIILRTSELDQPSAAVVRQFKQLTEVESDFHSLANDARSRPSLYAHGELVAGAVLAWSVANTLTAVIRRLAGPDGMSQALF
ncbi:MAG: hypothetical protein LBG11_06150, partial [Bifidobacteriaceae bacterium]|nr:hypothetical protein [Bifidobacteriaceae bacterium]